MTNRAIALFQGNSHEGTTLPPTSRRRFLHSTLLVFLPFTAIDAQSYSTYLNLIS